MEFFLKKIKNLTQIYIWVVNGIFKILNIYILIKHKKSCSPTRFEICTCSINIFYTYFYKLNADILLNKLGFI